MTPRSPDTPPPDDTTQPPTDAEALHQHRVTQDVAIIDAQAQLLLRRLRLNGQVDDDDLRTRLGAIMRAARRISDQHR